MEQNTVTINQLIAQMLDEMKRIGYSDTTIWRYYQPAMGQFRKYYEQTGRAEYSPDTTDEYVNLHRERYERGEITYQYATRRFCQRVRTLPEGYRQGGVLKCYTKVVTGVANEI